jgi:hypothetical protein
MTHEALDRPSEQSARIDTHALRLDHIEQLIHGAETYFAEHPRLQSFIFFASSPSTDTIKGVDYTFEVRRDRMQALKKMALSVYDTLREEGPLGKEIAQDIVQSWKQPVETPIFQERRLPYW